MDSKAQRKALFRARLRDTSQKREKHINSPLVKYNEDDQPVCRVCNIALKSELQWPAHQASRKHHEAIDNFKAAAATRQSTSLNTNIEYQESQPKSTLPSDFFDSQDTKKQRTDNAKIDDESVTSNSSMPIEAGYSKISVSSVQTSKEIGSNDAIQIKAVLPKNLFNKWKDGEHNSNQGSQVSKEKSIEINEKKGVSHSDHFDTFDSNSEKNRAKDLSRQSEKSDITYLKHGTTSLPAGFFDNKDEDLRARGIEPVKVDIDDAYKEFEKIIQEDLQEVDDRLEEEEIDAAEVREGMETLEQKTYRERVEMVKKRLIEVKESRLAKLQGSPEFKGKHSYDDDTSSSDDDVANDFTVDWRAKRF